MKASLAPMAAPKHRTLYRVLGLVAAFATAACGVVLLTAAALLGGLR